MSTRAERLARFAQSENVGGGLAEDPEAQTYSAWLIERSMAGCGPEYLWLTSAGLKGIAWTASPDVAMHFGRETDAAALITHIILDPGPYAVRPTREVWFGGEPG